MCSLFRSSLRTLLSGDGTYSYSFLPYKTKVSHFLPLKGNTSFLKYSFLNLFPLSCFSLENSLGLHEVWSLLPSPLVLGSYKSLKSSASRGNALWLKRRKYQNFKRSGFIIQEYPRDRYKPIKYLVSVPREQTNNSIMAAGEDSILYDVFIRAEWSLEGEVLVGFLLFNK